MADEPYNYDTFHRSMVREDLRFPGGPGPGEIAPDIDLPTIGGGRFHLYEHRGRRPVLLTSGSIT